jgi:hypothetical protein
MCYSPSVKIILFIRSLLGDFPYLFFASIGILRYLLKGVIEDGALLYSTFSCHLVSFSSFLPLFSQGQARPRKSGDRNPNHFVDPCTWIPVFTGMTESNMDKNSIF